MTTEISDYVSVSDRLAELGARYPSGLALLPANFETATSIAEFRQVSTAATVKTLFRNHDLPQDEIVEKAQRPPYIQNNALEFVLPTLFISTAFLLENQHLVSIALSVVANYATEFFKGRSGEGTVKLDIVVERTGSKMCRKVSYSGPADGLKHLPGSIKAASDE